MGTCLKWQTLFWRWSFLAKLSHGNVNSLPGFDVCGYAADKCNLPSVAAFFICAWSCSKSILPGQGKQKSAKLMKSEHHRSKINCFMRYKYPAGAEVPKGKDQKRWQKTCVYRMCQKNMPGRWQSWSLICYATHPLSTHLVTIAIFVIFTCQSSHLPVSLPFATWSANGM